MHRIDIVYPSTDPKGNPTEMSGYLAIPNDIYKDNAPVDGILLNSHYTQMGYDGAPTRGYAQGEDYVMANPLRLNYIVVCSDQYGYGVTEGKGYYYCYGDANAQAGIDCLLAARELLDARGISQGKLLINAGYSSGGYEAIAIQKLRDMKYRDVISFDKTVVSGIAYYLNLAAMMAALPILYYDGELNTHYADLVKDATPMTIIHKLEEKGIDLKKIVKERMASEGGGSGNIFSLLTQLDEKLQPYGLNSLELLQMADAGREQRRT
ncbi:MAG: hypothetical protein K6D91_09790 [Prevotella sp.]|nr:hypothetical protein [Prevotella sp.]